MAIFITYAIIQNVSPEGSFILLFVFILALPWVTWRSLKFNMRMTSFSNVRLGFDGTLGGAYINYFLLPIACFLALCIGPIIIGFAVAMMGLSLTVITGILLSFASIASIAFLGFAVYLYAFLKKKNTSYAINGFCYGQGNFFTQVETKAFASILLKTIGLSVLVMVAFIIITIIAATLMGMTNDLSLQVGSVYTVGFVYLGFILVSLLIVPYSYTRQRTYILNNSNLDNKITFASTLRATPFAWVMISNFIIVILTVGLGIPWAKVRMTRMILENTQVSTGAGFDDYITQKQQAQSSLGDQIGDAFDVDVGVGF